MENEIIEKVKRFPVAWVWLIVAIVGIAFAFYWFSVRPEQIRKQCFIESRSALYSYEASYKGCLVRNGLEK